MRSLEFSPEGQQIVRLALQERGLTQSETAKKLGVALSTVSAALNGRAIDKRVIHALCQLLDLEVHTVTASDEITVRKSYSDLVLEKLSQIEASIDQMNNRLDSIEKRLDVNARLDSIERRLDKD